MNIFNELPTDDQLDKADSYIDMAASGAVDDEDVSYLAELCDDKNLDAYMRKMLLQYNDNTGSKSAEELYLKQVIMDNNKTLEGLAKRQMEYEQQRKEQKTSANML